MENSFKLKEKKDSLENLDFNDLIRAYKDSICNTAYSICSNYDDAQDIMQEVFLKLFKKSHKFKGNSSYKTWIYRITVNTSIDFIRKKKRKRETVLPDENILQSFNDVSIKNLDNQALSNMIQDVLNIMPPKFRIFIILKDISSLSYNEISKVLNISLSSVKIGIFRARQKFKKLWEVKYEMQKI
ncbi:RNA polymerase sigma factor [bacterium]